MGLAGPLRRRAIGRLEDSRDNWVLDSGVGPGVSSRMMMMENGFKRIIGLDPSIILLRSAKTQLREHFYPLLAVAEYLPLCDRSIAGAITCFSLRDVRDRSRSIGEFARVVRKNGRLEIVDVGKPDNLFLRKIIGVYVMLVMPIVARVFIRQRSRKNPFRMIIPTFHRLSTNHSLDRLAYQTFGSSKLHEYLFGGLIIIEASKTGGNST